jgi:hypothetical protein
MQHRLQTRDSATLPPGAEDTATTEFERRIAIIGERRARWENLEKIASWLMK